jgi:hypothetical protein
LRRHHAAYGERTPGDFRILTGWLIIYFDLIPPVTNSCANHENKIAGVLGSSGIALVWNGVGPKSARHPFLPGSRQPGMEWLGGSWARVSRDHDRQ